MTYEEVKRRERERQRRKRALARELAMVRPKDLDALQRSGTVRPELEDLLLAADAEKLELATSLEGPRTLEGGRPNPDHRPLSAQRAAILEDTVRLGLVMRGELRRYCQQLDGDAGSRVGTLATARARLLGQLGLDPREREVPDLQNYLAAHAQRTQDTAQAAPHATNGADPDPAAAGAEIVAQEGEK